MQNALPVALSAQLALERRLETLADNIANMNTPGHVATKARLEASIQRYGGPAVVFAADGGDYLDPARGALDVTGNDLDFAVAGDAWFGIETPAGTVLTRDGRFTLGEDGLLRTVAGHPVLGPEGDPIALDPSEPAPVAANDGTLTQGDRIVGAIGLFAAELEGGSRWGNSGFVPSAEPVPALGDPNVGIRQGAIEGSNVDPIAQMVRLIEVSRGFESVSQLVQRADGRLSEALRSLAG